MKLLRRFLIRLSNFATARRADPRLREELAEHLAFQTEENLRAGMSPSEARRQAVLRLGAVEAICEHQHAEQGLPISRICFWTCGTRFARFDDRLDLPSWRSPQ
jgi:hypothetical protein